MIDCIFRHIIIIGYGWIAGEALRFVNEKRSVYRYDVAYIEHEPHPFNIAKKYAEENTILCATITDNGELTKKLLEITDSTLIVSASNNYLFPTAIAAKANITIINFHNALLPNYPGRNAPSWAIYQGERVSGITWHYVNQDIDGGDIIIQKKCEIHPDMKAYELANDLMHLALEAFQECFSSILSGSVSTQRQSYKRDRKMYLSTEVPGNAYFSFDDSPEYIYRLLRSVDYGKNNIFPPVYATDGKQRFKILRYKKIPKEKVSFRSGIRCLPYDTQNVLQLRYVEDPSNEN